MSKCDAITVINDQEILCQRARGHNGLHAAFTGADLDGVIVTSWEQDTAVMKSPTATGDFDFEELLLREMLRMRAEGYPGISEIVNE